MKNNKKGFLLAETLIVATFVTSTLIVLFIQLTNITSDYDVTFKYNTIDGLYSTNSIIDYLKENAINSEIQSELNDNNYISLSYCPFEYLYESNFCAVLLEKLNVKNVLIVVNNPAQLINELEQNRSFSETFINFVKYIKFENELYRLIVEFHDESYVSLPIKL